MRRVVLLLALAACAGCDRGARTEQAPSAVVLDDRLRRVEGEPIPLDRIVRVNGFAYSARISGRIPGLRDGGDGRTVRVVENGVALGPGGALSSDVVTLGAGRFNHETATRVLFSASDNSDPRRNERSYRVEWDEPARVVPRAATRTIGLGASEVVVDAATDRPVSPRRLVVENADAEHAVRVWARAGEAPDLTTRDAIVASIVRPDASDEEKALALWSALATWRHNDFAAAAGLEASDPVKLLGVYGFGFCNDVSHALASLLERAGLRARVVAWPQHTVVEARIDGRWRLLDADLGRVYRTRSGEFASVADVFARRATAAFSPLGEVPLAQERFDFAYPRGADRSYARAFGTSGHALRPVLEPGDVVVFDFDRGDHVVDRFSLQHPADWPIRSANGTLRRTLGAADAEGCRAARVDWPYPIVGARVVARGLAPEATITTRVRAVDTEAWQDLRTERTGADASADAGVWLAHGPIRYGAEARVCGAEVARWRAPADLAFEIAFQFAPRTIPHVGSGASTSVWSVEEAARGARVGRGFAGVRVTQEWDELDAAIEPALPSGAVVVNLDTSFLVHATGPGYATGLLQQLPPGVTVGPPGGLDVVALLENGRGIGERVAAPALVAAGRGRFALDGGQLVLSASDGTDPRSNGRLYSVVLAPAGAAPPAGD